MKVELMRYLPVVFISLALFLFLYKQWGWLKGVLSDGTPVADKDGKIISDKDGNPIFLGSCTRVLAFLFGIMCMLCEMFFVLKKEDFDIKHLCAFLLMIGAFLGLIKLVDAFSIAKGNLPKSD